MRSSSTTAGVVSSKQVRLLKLTWVGSGAAFATVAVPLLAAAQDENLRSVQVIAGHAMLAGVAFLAATPATVALLTLYLYIARRWEIVESAFPWRMLSLCCLAGFCVGAATSIIAFSTQLSDHATSLQDFSKSLADPVLWRVWMPATLAYIAVPRLLVRSLRQPIIEER